MGLELWTLAHAGSRTPILLEQPTLEALFFLTWAAEVCPPGPRHDFSQDPRHAMGDALPAVALLWSALLGAWSISGTEGISSVRGTREERLAGTACVVL